MALIKCPECAQEVSEKAKACPHCGYPISELFSTNSDNPENVEGLKSDVINSSESESIYKPLVEVKVFDSVSSFRILEQPIEFGTEELKYIKYRRAYELVADECHSRISEMYANLSLDKVIVEASNLMNVVIPNLIKESVRSLYESGTVISIETFYQKYCNLSFDYEDRIDEVVEKYAEITQERQQLEQYRSMQKAARSRFVGGGFGVKGAIKGAVTASVMNAGLDFARSFGDNRQERKDDQYISQRIKELKDSSFCRSRIINGAYSCAISIFYAMMSEMANNGMAVNAYKLKDVEAKNLFQATMQFEENEDKKIAALVKTITLFPYYYEPYKELYIISNKRNDLKSIDSIYALCFFLGMTTMSYGEESIDDIYANVFVNGFFDESEVLNGFGFDNYDPEIYARVLSEEERLNGLIEMEDLKTPVLNPHLFLLSNYKSQGRLKVDADT